MGYRPKRLCAHCGRAYRGVCACGRGGKSGWQSDSERGTRQSRGYDNDWLKLRATYIAEHPLCEECERQGKLALAEQVHHKAAFTGVDDERRLDWENLESLCAACHAVKTRGHRDKR